MHYVWHFVHERRKKYAQKFPEKSLTYIKVIKRNHEKKKKKKKTVQCAFKLIFLQKCD